MINMSEMHWLSVMLNIVNIISSIKDSILKRNCLILKELINMMLSDINMKMKFQDLSKNMILES